MIILSWLARFLLNIYGTKVKAYLGLGGLNIEPSNAKPTAEMYLER